MTGGLCGGPEDCGRAPSLCGLHWVRGGLWRSGGAGGRRAWRGVVMGREDTVIAETEGLVVFEDNDFGVMGREDAVIVETEFSLQLDPGYFMDTSPSSSPSVGRGDFQTGPTPPWTVHGLLGHRGR